MIQKANIYLFCIVGCLLLSKWSNVYAQHFDIAPTLFGTEQGLSQGYAGCVWQDARGFIWIGTQDGLNRYDGYKFKRYGHDPLDSNSISSNYIQSICETRDGRLVVATQFGLNIYHFANDAFTRYVNNPDDENSLYDNKIFYVVCDSEGIVWCRSEYGLSRFMPAEGKFKFFPFPENTKGTHNEYNTFGIADDGSNNLWLGTPNGLLCFDKTTQKYTHYTHNADDEHSLSANEVFAVYTDKNARLWVGTARGVDVFDAANKTFNRYRYRSPALGNTPNKIASIFQDSKGMMWFGASSGLVTLNTATNKLQAFENGLYDLTIYDVTNIVEDRSNIMWVSTTTGLWKIDTKRQKFRLYQWSPDSEFRLSSNDITALWTQPNEIWVGTRDNGLNIINRSTNEVQVFNTNNSKVIDDHIYAFHRDMEGRFWIATKGGLMLCSPDNYDFLDTRELYPDVNLDMLENKRIYCLESDTEKRLWIGTQAGLYMFDGVEVKGYFNQPTDNTSLSSNEVYVLLNHDDRYLWIGTNNGLNYMDKQTGKCKRYQKRLNSDKGLSNNSVLSLYRPNVSTLWVGTESGLNLFDLKADHFTFYTQKDGFASDYIYSIQPDRFNTLWMSTNKGIARFSTSTGIINFDIVDGLQDWEFNLGAWYKSAQGEMFFGGINGFNSFFPDSLQINQYTPPVNIVSISVINRLGEPSIHPVYNNSIFEFDYSNYMFTIEFALPEYSHPERNSYKYKMEGLNEQWIELGNRNIATFPQLQPGEYNFRVMGANNDRVWTAESTDITIIVNPPIWKTSVAYVLYVLVAGMLAYIVLSYITQNLRKENMYLKEKEKSAYEIAVQKDELAAKNISLTDSLNYAQRIIKAMLPPPRRLNEMIPQSFVLYLPKDIVSGDFYWFSREGDKIFIAAVDCTGHGIPGAFMSIIGFDLLRNIIKGEDVFSPEHILERLHEEVVDILGSSEETRVKDGMDLALCVIDMKTNTLEYAGAFNSLILIRDNNLVEYEADRFSVGLGLKQDHNKFTKHTIPLQPDDMFYIFSDGFCDQFGGPKGKKFKYRRFRHLLLNMHHLHTTQQQAVLEKTLNNWRGSLEQVDDVLIIGLRPLAEKHPKHHENLEDLVFDEAD